MQPWEGNHVHCQLAKVSVKLSREPEAGSDTRHCDRNQMVQVSVGWGGKLESAEADVIESFVVDAVCLVGILNQLVNRQGSVVGLNNGVRDLESNIESCNATKSLV